MDESWTILANAVRAGDTDALARFVSARRPQLLAYIERNLSAALRRKVEPEDILQEVCAAAVRALAQTGLEERDPFGWLCQLAERRIIDAHRRYVASQKRAAGREVALDARRSDSDQGGLVELLVASMTSASKAFSRDQRQQRLLTALERLPVEQRSALEMRYLENLPSKEIATRLGKSDGAVRVLLTRSLRRLQELLAPDEETTT